MKRVETIEDYLSGTATYELSDGRFVKFYAEDIKRFGLSTLLNSCGAHEDTSERVQVVQHGRVVGTVPGDFDPLFIKSKSFFYDPRPGDFKHDGKSWVASRTLGPGDLLAIPGFAPEKTEGEA